VGESHLPLIDVLCILLLRTHVGDELIREVAEHRNAGLLRTSLPPMLDGIDSGCGLSAAFARYLACARKRHARESTEVHIVCFLAALELECPTLEPLASTTR
jgi:hypothetical protein